MAKIVEQSRERGQARNVEPSLLRNRRANLPSVHGQPSRQECPVKISADTESRAQGPRQPARRRGCRHATHPLSAFRSHLRYRHLPNPFMFINDSLQQIASVTFKNVRWFELRDCQRNKKNPPTSETLLCPPAPTASAQELRGFRTPSMLCIGRRGKHDVFQRSAAVVLDAMNVSRSSAGKFHCL